LKNNADLLIALYQKSLEKFKELAKNYQQSHSYELVWIYNNLANIYLIHDEFNHAKTSYQCALNEMDFFGKNKTILVNYTELEEGRYFILYNLLILAKLENNKSDYQVILKQLKECESFNKYEIFYLKRRKVNKLKCQLRYFSKCWLLGCEHCNNLADDE
jgi:hypothetical protein